ncbi:MAG: tetratricopeptide repeat protein [Rhodospirillales bacterium]|nr:tetratricopeptide repeat protein [Rhodospirillales bacterium]
MRLPAIPLPFGDVLRIATEYERAGRLGEAEALLVRCLAAAPNQPDALHEMGLVAFRQGRLSEALARMEAAIAHGIDTPLYWRNICTVYEQLGRLNEAVAAGKKAVALDPADPAAYHNLTIAHYRRLDLDAAIGCARQALALDPTLPGAHFALAEAQLLQGDLAAGWEEYEWRFRIPGAMGLLPEIPAPPWDGSPTEGTLLLLADQGFGDTIQFARYIPWAATRAGRIVLICGREMRPLLRQLLPEAALVTRWREAPACAAWCPLSGLPRLAGTRLGSIPAPIPYLTVEPERAARWSARLDSLVPRGFRRIGIAWAGRPTHNNDANRSARLADLAPLGGLPETALVVLQKGAAAEQVRAYYGGAPLINLATEIDGFADTAAAIAALDLVVSVDTSVVHLAGAMGRPVWILLAYGPDWRWLLGREDSPWYPTARLFRQDAPRDWASALRKVTRALAEA